MAVCDEDKPVHVITSLVMDHYRHAGFYIVVKVGGLTGWHVDATVASTGSVDTTAEGTSPPGIMTAVSVIERHPVFYLSSILAAISIITLEGLVACFVQEIISSCRCSVTGRSCSRND